MNRAYTISQERKTEFKGGQYVLTNRPTLSNRQLPVLDRGKLAQGIPGRKLEFLGGFLVLALGEFDFVVETQLLEEPGSANAARGLEKVKDYRGHVGKTSRFVYDECS